MALRGQIERLVRSIVPTVEVEDIVQETYVRMCQVENKDAIREPRAYMFRTARNLALDHVKRAESRLASNYVDELPEQDFLVSPDDDPTYSQVASDEEFVLFCEAVRSLPKQSRRAFILKKVYGYSLKEIMAEMNLGQPTVETHIVNATKKCVQFMRRTKIEKSLPEVGLSFVKNNGRSPLGRRGRDT